MKKIYRFLKLNGFELIEKDTSAFFGDYCDVFINENLLLRINSSKSFVSFDLRINQVNEDWYDLALVKIMLYNEKKTNSIATIEEIMDFLQNELATIIDLFKDINYLNTKKRLDQLENERVKQMFPKMR